MHQSSLRLQLAAFLAGLATQVTGIPLGIMEAMQKRNAERMFYGLTSKRHIRARCNTSGKERARRRAAEKMRRESRRKNQVLARNASFR